MGSKKTRQAAHAEPTRARVGEWCFAVRESDLDAYEQWGNMQRAAMGPYTHVPGVQKMLDLGVTVLMKGREYDALRAELGAVPYYVPGSKSVAAWLFVVDGTLFYFALISAAKPDMTVTDDHQIEMRNGFTDGLARVITEYEAANLVTGPFHRIVRSKAIGATLYNACVHNKTIVKCMDAPAMDMGTKGGKDAWTFQTFIADGSYTGIVQGLVNGHLARFVDGRYSRFEVPGVGYKLRNEKDRTPEPDLALIPLVQDLIAWAAEDETKVSNTEIAKRLSEKYKWGSATLRKRAKDDALTIAESRFPEVNVRNLLRASIPLWRDGVLRHTMALPYHITNDMIRQDCVQHYDAESHSITIDIPLNHDLLPQGRWADPKLIEKAARRIERGDAKPTGRAAAKEDRKPLSGVGSWSDGKTEWTLSARHRENYLVLNRPHQDGWDKNGKRVGWVRSENVTIAGMVHPHELHKGLAERIVAALSDEGVQWRRGTKAAIVVDATQEDADRLAEGIREMERKRRTKVEMAEDAWENGDKDIARRYNAEAQEISDRITEAQREYGAVTAALTEAAPLDSESAEAGTIAALLAELHGTENTAGPDLNTAILNLIPRLEVEMEEGDLNVLVRAWVRVQTNTGPIVAGPVALRVPNHRREVTMNRHERAMRSILRDGMRLEEAAREAGYTDAQACRRRVNELLADHIPSRYLRSAIIDCPIAETKAVVWEMVDSARSGRPFSTPAGMDKAFVQHIRTTYSAAEREWTVSWAADSHTAGRRALDFVKAGGVEGVRYTDLIKHAAERIDETMVRYFIEEVLRGKGASRKSGYLPLVDRGPKFHSHNPDRRVFAQRCPFCNHGEERTLTHLLRVPEVPGGLLCTECRRTPALSAVQFPEDYLRNWAGPRGIGTGRKVAHTSGTHEA